MESHERYGRKETLGLSGGARSGRVNQSFSRGRTKSVVVETKRKRVMVPKPGAQSAAAQNAEGGKRDKSVPDAELERRLKALQAAKAREAEDEERRASEEKEREEERARRRAEAEAKEREERSAKKRSRPRKRKTRRRKAEEEARRNAPRARRRTAAQPDTAAAADKPRAVVAARAPRRTPQGRRRPRPWPWRRPWRTPFRQADREPGARRWRRRPSAQPRRHEAQAGAPASEGHGRPRTARRSSATCRCPKPSSSPNLPTAWPSVWPTWSRR
jgi:hypothetical protein